MIEGPVEPFAEKTAFFEAAARLLPEALDETAWKTWTDAVKAETGAKGRDLYQPLRKALTGLEHGPEMGPLVPLIGRERILARLKGEAA